MESTQPATDVLRFGVFELDGTAGELRRNGSLVRLPPQPFRVLMLLARQSGELVDRERIRREIWGEIELDFDRSLNVCIAQIRAALGDDADTPRFIQTLPKRGYRFLAQVQRAGAPVSPLPVAADPMRAHRSPAILPLAVGCMLLAVIAALGYWLWPRPVPPIRIAILPFETVGSADIAQADGLFDELLTRLGGIQPDRLRVIGRNSVVRFRKDPKPLREVGERLNVSHILEGTVRSEEGRVRVALRLVQASGESALWTETLTQESGPGEFEEQFVARVAAALLTNLFPDSEKPAIREAACRDGWESYRTGQLLAHRGSIADLRQSVALFDKAACAPARAALAETLIRLGRIGIPRSESWERARPAARAALEADPNSAAAHVSVANVALWLDWDWQTAQREFQTALRLNPSDSGAHHDQAWLLMALGRRHEALAALQRAIALDPLSVRIHADAGWLLLQAGRFREAALQARRTLALEPGLNEARACLSRALLYAGEDQEALDAIRPLLPEGDLVRVASLAPAEAIRVLFRDSIRPKGEMDPYQRAWRLAWAGSTAEALSEVEAAHQKRSLMMPLVAVDPAFASIRKESRFQKIVQQMGLK